MVTRPEVGDRPHWKMCDDAFTVIDERQGLPIIVDSRHEHLKVFAVRSVRVVVVCLAHVNSHPVASAHGRQQVVKPTWQKFGWYGEIA